MPEFALRLPKAKAALAYAEGLHRGQRRSVDGAPFITHLIEVGTLLYQAEASDDVVAAGVLHDALEKSDASAYEISARFGRRVGDIVCAVSHDPGVPGYARRKTALRNQVAKAGEDALTVFAADKLSKVRELRLDNGSQTKVRSRKLRHYRLSLAMLQEHLPDSSLVSALATQLSALQDGARVRVVIADDSYLVRVALEQILSRADGIDVARSCADRDSLLRAIEEERPDVVLTDIPMPPTGTDEGIQVARDLRRTHPEIGVVVLSQFADPGHLLNLLDSGSDGRAYLLKDRVSDPRELTDAVKAVASGASVVDSEVIDVLVRARRNGAASPLDELTPREHEVLAELAQGKSNGAIAQSLVLTKRAVEKHINAIFMKLNLAPLEDVSPRVKATLAYLASDGDALRRNSTRPS